MGSFILYEFYLNNYFLKLKVEQSFDFIILIDCIVILKTKVNYWNFFLCTNNILKNTKEFSLAL